MTTKLPEASLVRPCFGSFRGAWPAPLFQLESDADVGLYRGGSSFDGNGLCSHLHGSRRHGAGDDDALVFADGQDLSEFRAGRLGIELGVGDGVSHGKLARFVLEIGRA